MHATEIVSPGVGTYTQVIFKLSRDRSGVVGDADQFNKVALVGRRYTGEMPRPGEEWFCEIVHDTNRFDPTRGAGIVKPIRRLQEEKSWILEFGFEDSVRAICVTKVGYRVTGREGVLVRFPSDIRVAWPADFRRQCEQALALSDYRYTVGDRQEAGQPAHPVVCLSYRQYLRTWEQKYPVRQLSDISAEWPEWVRQDATRRCNRYRDALVLSSLSGGKPQGRGTEYPFQWVTLSTGRFLTNGKLHIPPVRPEGQQWRNYPFAAIPSACWELFLQGLEGKFLEELLPFRKQVVEQRKQPRQPRLTERQREVAAMAKGAMWTGGDCERVSFGRNLVFTVTRGERGPIHVVDNPGIGAIYLFDDKVEATKLASGEVRRSEARRKEGCRRIIHRTGWQAKLTAAIS